MTISTVSRLADIPDAVELEPGIYAAKFPTIVSSYNVWDNKTKTSSVEQRKVLMESCWSSLGRVKGRKFIHEEIMDGYRRELYKPRGIVGLDFVIVLHESYLDPYVASSAYINTTLVPDPAEPLEEQYACFLRYAMIPKSLREHYEAMYGENAWWRPKICRFVSSGSK